MTPPNDPQQLLADAKKRFDEGRYTTACHLYDRLIRLDPSLPEPYHRRGLAFARRERYIEAAASFEQARKRGLQPTPRDRLEIGRVYAALGRRQEALAEYADANRIAPSAETHDAAGRFFAQQNDFDNAILEFQRAIAADPNHTDALLQGAQAFANKGSADQALDWYIRAFTVLASRPKADEEAIETATSALAKAVQSLPAPESTLPQIRQVLEAANNSTLTQEWAVKLAEIGQLEEARAVAAIPFRNGIPAPGSLSFSFRSLLSDFAPTRRDDLTTGDFFYELARLHQTLEETKRALSLGQSPEAHDLWGRILMQEGLAESSVAHLVEALPHSVKSNFHGNWQSLRAGLSKVGNPAWKQKIENVMRTADDPGHLVEWARALNRMGFAEDALQKLETALRQNPEYEPAYAVLERSDRLRADANLIQRLDKVVSASKSALAHLRWGSVLSRLGKHQEALPHFLAALGIDPQNGDAGLGAARAARALEKYDPACDFYFQAIEAHPEQMDAFTECMQCLGELQKQKGVIAQLVQIFGNREGNWTDDSQWQKIQDTRTQHDARVRRLCDAICRDLDRAAPYFPAADSLGAQGMSAYALRLLERAAAIAPDDSFGHYRCGFELQRLGRFEEAIQEYQQALRLKPDHFDSYRGAAQCLSSLRRFGQAAEMFANAFLQGTDFGTTVESQIATARSDTYSDWAFALSEDRKFDESLEKSRLALEADPKSYWSYFRKAYTLTDMGRHEAAVAEYEKAVAIEKDKPYAHHNISYLLGRQGRYKPGRTEMKALVGLYQDGIADAIRGLQVNDCIYYAYALTELKQLDRAEALYLAGRALDPDNPAVHYGLATVYLEKKKRLNETDEARRAPADEIADRATHLQWQSTDAYLAAVRLLEQRLVYTRDAGTLMDLAEIHLMMEEREKALATFTEALQVQKGSVRVHKGLGDSNLRLGNYPAAIRNLESAYRLAPDDLSVRELLARARLRSGALDEAESEYQEILKITRFHVDSLAGLAEVYLAMADKQERGSAGREDFYLQAIELFDEASQLCGTANCSRDLTRSERASYSYLRGYAKVQLWEQSRVRYRRMANQALHDFDQSLELDPSHQKARRATGRMRDELRGAGPQGWMDRWVPGIVVALALLLFVMAQFGVFIGVPAREPRAALTAESMAGLARAGLPADALAKLKPMESKSYRSFPEMLAEAQKRLGPDAWKSAQPLVERYAFLGDAALGLRPMELSIYALLTFGALLVLMAGAYLPQLSSLKLAGLQLEKGTAERAEPVRSIGIRQ